MPKSVPQMTLIKVDPMLPQEPQELSPQRPFSMMLFLDSRDEFMKSRLNLTGDELPSSAPTGLPQSRPRPPQAYLCRTLKRPTERNAVRTAYEERFQRNRLRYGENTAKSMGYTLVMLEEKNEVSGQCSSRS